MQFGLINNGGQWEIPQNILNMLNFSVHREYSIDWMFYYYIEIFTIEDINNLVDFFGKITIDVDPTTSSQYVIGINHDYNKKEEDGEVPF